MSAGHGHSRTNLKRPEDLEHLLSSGGAPELMARWKGVSPDFDVVDTCGYNVDGTWVFIDRDFWRALHEPTYAEHIGVGPIDTGLSVPDTLHALITHEKTEQVILLADNAINDYLGAHEYATLAEHTYVRSKGVTPLRYERGLSKAIKFCEAKTPSKVPPDFDCAPLLDDPDANDRRVIKIMQRLGIGDAFKISKRAQDYSASTGPDSCIGCKNWQGARTQMLAPCAVIEGLVRDHLWCRKFEPINQPLGVAAQSPAGPGGTNEQTVQAGGPQRQVTPGAEYPGGAEDPAGAPGGSGALQQP